MTTENRLNEIRDSIQKLRDATKIQAGIKIEVPDYT
jgi:hypothetical protein